MRKRGAKTERERARGERGGHGPREADREADGLESGDRPAVGLEGGDREADGLESGDRPAVERPAVERPAVERPAHRRAAVGRAADAELEGSGVRASPGPLLAERSDPALPLERPETSSLDVLAPEPAPPSPEAPGAPPELANGELVSDLSADALPAPEYLVPGTLIADRFRVGRMLGRGGHGFVYEAEHVVLGYPVAIKVLCTASRDPRRRARFRREALLGARLRHRNVVSIHDAGELEDGSPFLVMEHVDGDDLSTVIAQCGMLDAAATVEIGVQLLAAVTALCERGVIHRDIKPNNVMLQRSVDGYVEVKLLDFGISKAMRAELALKTLTADDCVLGTPQYMSPEQVRGETLDVRADLYSVGALLYECLTGRPPFDAETPGAVLAKILTEEAPTVAELREDVPQALAVLVDRAVAKHPDARWAHPAEMAEALRAIAQRLHLPRGADAWASLATEVAAPFGTMALGLVRPRASSRPPGAQPAPPKALATAAERPVSKGRAPEAPSPEAREPTARVRLPGAGLLRTPATEGRWLALAASLFPPRGAPRGEGRGRWLPLALVLPVALGVASATWIRGVEQGAREGASGARQTVPTNAGSSAPPGPVAAAPATPVATADAPSPGVASPGVASPGVASPGVSSPGVWGPGGPRPGGPTTGGSTPGASSFGGSTSAGGPGPAAGGGSPNVLRPIAISSPLEREVRRAPDAADLERRALSAFLAGRDAEAVSLYTRATQLAPTRASAWRGLGLAAAARDPRTASRALRRYLELAPSAADRRSIEQRLARL